MRLVLLFSSLLFSYAEVPFQISLSKTHVHLKQKRSTKGKIFVDFYEGKRKLSEHTYSAFVPESETLEVLIPKSSSNKTQADSVLITVLNVQYIHEKSVHMFGSGPGQFREGKSIKGDSFNQIYIVDTAQEAVLKFNEKLQFLDKFGSFNIDESQSFEKDFANIEEAQFDGINDLIAGPRLTTFITDTRNQRVVEVDSSGNFVREFNPRDGFDEPTKLQTNSRHEILVLDSENERIVVFNHFGNQVFTIGGYGTGDYRFIKLLDFIVDKEDNLICLDQLEKESLIKKFSRNGRLLSKKTLKEKYEIIASDYWGHLILLAETKIKVLDSNLRPVMHLFTNPKNLYNAEAITYVDNKKLYTLHNDPSMVKIFSPRLTLLQKKMNLQKD
ncbi:MAG: NHL repeat-containing protein [bacterium]|nr:NHL repeat-containing protein [bacterium]